MTREDFMRLIRHMKEDGPNQKAKDTLSRGREILRAMTKPLKSPQDVSQDPRSNDQ
jgi:hypothetical protein